MFSLSCLADNVEIWYNLYIGYYDYRGSTVAITDDSGAVTDAFEYDSYGKLINRTDESFVIFGYNGRDGVITDYNGLLYMRARYYSPELRRFINADIIPGEISNAITLNRYAYANGNPVSNIDPFGLSAERGNTTPQINFAYYVVDYELKEGLPVVGHTKLYFIDTEGRMYLTEFTGDFPNKDTASVCLIKNQKQVSEYFNSDMERANIFFDKFFTTRIVALEGDFTESYKLAEMYSSGKAQYPDYNLITNSCLSYTNQLLDAAEFYNPVIDAFFKYDDYYFVPGSHINHLQFIDYTMKAGETIIDFAKDAWDMCVDIFNGSVENIKKVGSFFKQIGEKIGL